MRLCWFSTAFLPLVLGATIDARNQCQAYDDTYDDIATGAEAATNQPFNNYHGSLYQGWTVSNHSSPTSDIASHTFPNVIIANAVTDLMSIGAVILNPFGNLLRGTGTKAFDLKSLFFGCSQVTSEGALGVAVGCTVAVTGYDVSGKQIPVETFSFAPATQLVHAKMNAAVLSPRFVGLQNVTFGLAQGGGTEGAVGTILVFDDIVHCNHS